jgi:hypothetical protein
MTIQESLSILRIYQQWRMGADIPMLEPKEITEAINTVLEYIPQVLPVQISNDSDRTNTPQVVDKLGNEDVPKLGYLDELAEEHITKHHLNHSYNTSKFSFKEGYNKGISQTEISYEEIEKEAEQYHNNQYHDVMFIAGANWYREQLKQRQ